MVSVLLPLFLYNQSLSQYPENFSTVINSHYSGFEILKLMILISAFKNTRSNNKIMGSNICSASIAVAQNV